VLEGFEQQDGRNPRGCGGRIVAGIIEIELSASAVAPVVVVVAAAASKQAAAAAAAAAASKQQQPQFRTKCGCGATEQGSAVVRFETAFLRYKLPSNLATPPNRKFTARVHMSQTIQDGATLKTW
jgi:hypothetical protein